VDTPRPYGPGSIHATDPRLLLRTRNPDGLGKRVVLAPSEFVVNGKPVDDDEPFAADARVLGNPDVEEEPLAHRQVGQIPDGPGSPAIDHSIGHWAANERNRPRQLH
jgi:hypothetical protein